MKTQTPTVITADWCHTDILQALPTELKLLYCCTDKCPFHHADTLSLLPTYCTFKMDSCEGSLKFAELHNDMLKRFT